MLSQPLLSCPGGTLVYSALSSPGRASVLSLEPLVWCALQTFLMGHSFPDRIHPSTGAT